MRIRYFFPFSMCPMLLQDKLALSVTEEQGKTLSDAKGDVFRGLGASGSDKFLAYGVMKTVQLYLNFFFSAEVVEATCGISPFMSGDVLEGVAQGIDCYSIRQPLGVRARRRGPSIL